MVLFVFYSQNGSLDHNMTQNLPFSPDGLSLTPDNAPISADSLNLQDNVCTYV